VTSEHPINFGPFCLDLLNERLRRGSQTISLRPKTFAVLRYLLEHPGQLVTKEGLLDAVWPETYVSDVVLKVCIREIREVLGDDPKVPQYIETVHRRGYRFIGQIADCGLQIADSKPSDASGPSIRHQPPATDWPPASDQLQSAIRHRQSAINLVGRQAELAQLQRWLEKSVRGQRHVVFVTGEPGIGKTTLVEAFLEQASAAGLGVARGQCLEQFGAGEAYLPVLEALGRLCREPGRERLIALLGQYAPMWLVQMPSLISVADRERLQKEIFGATPERMLREMAEAVEALTAESPLVLGLEDLHWSDNATLDLITSLARRQGPARLLVIGTYRPTEVILSQHPLKAVRQELQMHGQCKELPLEFLTEAAVAEYLTRRFPGHRFPVELAGLIHQRTDGNPLFMVNMVDYLLAQGILVERDGQWRLEGQLEEVKVGVPEGIQQMIEKQIDRLTPEQQRVLEAASVAGVEFSAAAVAAALEEEVDQIEACCEGLGRGGQFLRPTGVIEWPDGTVAARYCFTHSLYHSVWYQRVAKARRIRLHKRIGERMEVVFGNRAGEIAAELAMHFEHGRDYRRAVWYLRHAAENATRRYANREAIDCLTRALELVGRLPPAERSGLHMHVLEQRGLVRRSGGDMEGAAKDFEALAAFAGEQGRVEVQVIALLYLGNALLWVDRERCLTVGEQAVEISRQLNDELLRAHARGYLGHWHSLMCGWRDEDAQACVAAIDAARRADDVALLSLHVGRYSYFQFARSEYRAAYRTAEEGLQLALEVGDVFNYLVCQFSRARSLLHVGQWGDVLRILRDGLQMAEKNGQHQWAMIFRIGLAWLHLEALDFAGARQLCETVLERTREGYIQVVGHLWLGLAHLGLEQYELAFHCFSEINRWLQREPFSMNWIWLMPLHQGWSQYWLAQGEFERARQEAEQVCELAAQPGERTWMARGRRRLTQIAMAQGHWDQAEAELSRAVAAVEGIEAPLAEWRVYATAAQLHQQQGRNADTDRARSAAILNRLLDSLSSDGQLPADVMDDAGRLRQRFLGHPLVQAVLRHARSVS
jgi:DNA-binding winged helix-turn-helix (wHTH) protein/tetratricopeptide (TPR) repeat protein